MRSAFPRSRSRPNIREIDIHDEVNHGDRDTALKLKGGRDMLVLKRNEGQWIEVRHRSGDLLRIKVTRIRMEGMRGVLNLGFEDEPRHFEIRREEAGHRNVVPVAGVIAAGNDESPAASGSPPEIGVRSG